MLKPKFELKNLPEDSGDVYQTNKLDQYLNRPPELSALTYPDFFRWWRKSASEEHKKGEKSVHKNKVPSIDIRCKNKQDFKSFMEAKLLRGIGTTTSLIIHKVHFSTITSFLFSFNTHS